MYIQDSYRQTVLSTSASRLRLRGLTVLRILHDICCGLPTISTGASHGYHSLRDLLWLGHPGRVLRQHLPGRVLDHWPCWSDASCCLATGPLLSVHTELMCVCGLCDGRVNSETVIVIVVWRSDL